MFVTRADWSRRALTQPEMMDPKMGGKFNTTEIHCTEYHPAVRAGDSFPNSVKSLRLLLKMVLRSILNGEEVRPPNM